MRLFGKGEPAKVKASIEELETRQQTLAERIEAGELARRENVLEASAGNDQARAELVRANKELAEARAELADTDLALDEARRRLAKAERDEAAARRKRDRARLATLLDRRRELAGQVESTLRDLAKLLATMETDRAEIEALFEALRPAAEPDRPTVVVETPLRKSETAGRLAQAALGAGLAEWFELKRLPIMAGAASFAELDGAAEGYYRRFLAEPATDKDEKREAMADTPPEAA